MNNEKLKPERLLWIPKDLNLLEILPEKEKKHIDKYHYVFHAIIERRIFDKRYKKKDYVNLHSAVLRKILTKRRAKPILKFLEENKLLKIHHAYYPDRRSKSYRIIKKYRNNGIKGIKIIDPKFMQRLLEFKHVIGDLNHAPNSYLYNRLNQIKINSISALCYIAKKVAHYNSDIHINEKIYAGLGIDKNHNISFSKELSEIFISHKIESKTEKVANTHLMLDQNEIDYPLKHSEVEGEFCSKNLYNKLHDSELNELIIISGNNIDSIDYSIDDYYYDLMSIFKIHNKEFFFVRDDFGRVHNNIVNLPGRLRKFLQFPNTELELVNIDLRNSQPLFFVQMLKEYCKSKKINIKKTKDVEAYINITSEGKFYEYVGESLKMSVEDRKFFKTNLFKKVFFCKNFTTKHSAEGKVFKKLFPTAYKAILYYKKPEYQNLARRLQKIESRLIIDDVIKKIAERDDGTFVLTIHDSIICYKSEKEFIKNEIMDSFKSNYHLSPTLEAEDFKEYLTEEEAWDEIEDEDDLVRQYLQP